MPRAPRRRSSSSWRPFAVVLGVAFAALIATIIFIACTGTPNTTPNSTPTPGSSATADVTTTPTIPATPTGPVSTDGSIPTGTTVNGIDLSGLTAGEAQQQLEQGLADPSTGMLTINIGALHEDVTYASVSRAYDFAATIAAAFAAGGNTAISPVTSYDTNALGSQVNPFVATAQAASVNATISYVNGQYVMTATGGGLVDAAAVLLNAGALMGNGNPDDQTLDIPVTSIPADINSPDAQAAILRAQAVTAAPLTLTAGGRTFVVDALTLRTWVQAEQTTVGQWALTVDDAAVTAYLNTIKAQVDQPPVDASWHFGDAAVPIVVPSQTGYELDASAAVTQIETAVGAATGPLSTIALSVIATQPAFTTAMAQAQAGNVELLGEWTTHYIPSHFNGDGVNIRRPASLIDGTVIQPGDLFDFYRLTGPYTIANGYTDGAAIIHGNTKGEGVLGGGLCSASTTMFNAALRAGFQMGQRHNHFYYITRYPIGLDATIWVSGNSVKNMTFTNDSKYPIVIRSINKKRAVTFQVWGVGDGRTVSLADPIVSDPVVANQYFQYSDDPTLGPRGTSRTEFGADGFDAIVTRTVRDSSGNIIHSDTFQSHYGKVDGNVLLGRCSGDPDAGTKIPLSDTPPPCGGPSPSPSHTPQPTGTGGGPTPSPSPTSTPSAAPSPTPTPSPSPAPTP